MRKVCILMSTYNGEKYLKEQIDSLIEQRDVEVTICVRDDGSSDKTEEILKSYTDKEIKYFKGTNVGVANSFMDLLFQAPVADYYAFCDQDDVWDNNKLAQAVSVMESDSSNAELPKMYYSNVKVVDEKLELIKISDINKEYNNLKTVLLSNNAIGCTVVFNAALLEKIRLYKPSYIYMHDWWMYLVCLSLKGKVYFDQNAYINYRQHGSNCVGFATKKRSLRKALFTKPVCIVNKMANELLNGYGGYMHEEERTIVETVAKYNHKIKYKMNLLRDNAFYKAKGMSLLAEKIAVLRNRK